MVTGEREMPIVSANVAHSRCAMHCPSSGLRPLSPAGSRKSRESLLPLAGRRGMGHRPQAVRVEGPHVDAPKSSCRSLIRSMNIRGMICSLSRLKSTAFDGGVRHGL